MEDSIKYPHRVYAMLLEAFQSQFCIESVIVCSFEGPFTLIKEGQKCVLDVFRILWSVSSRL